MRITLVFLAFISVFAMCFADIDKTVADFMGNGATYMDGSTKVFMAKPFFADEYLEEDNAYDFLAISCMLFLAVREDWVELKSSSTSSYIKSLDQVGAPWTNEYQYYVVTIPIREIEQKFCESYNLSDEVLLRNITSYIRNNADHHIAANY
jgi:hypothetical protein